MGAKRYRPPRILEGLDEEGAPIAPSLHKAIGSAMSNGDDRGIHHGALLAQARSNWEHVCAACALLDLASRSDEDRHIPPRLRVRQRSWWRRGSTGSWVLERSIKRLLEELEELDTRMVLALTPFVVQRAQLEAPPEGAVSTLIREGLWSIGLASSHCTGSCTCDFDTCVLDVAAFAVHDATFPRLIPVRRSWVRLFAASRCAFAKSGSSWAGLNASPDAARSHYPGQGTWSFESGTYRRTPPCEPRAWLEPTVSVQPTEGSRYREALLESLKRFHGPT
jgi:hypothetical protein